MSDSQDLAMTIHDVDRLERGRKNHLPIDKTRHSFGL